METINMPTFKLNNLVITALSDTHGHHRDFEIPECDIVIHAGDACNDGDEGQLVDFFEWFSTLPAKYKIFVAGNHDLIFDLDPEKALKIIPKNVIFLENQSFVIEDIVFHGVVSRPWMHEPHLLPKSIDVLISHGPSDGILDEGGGCVFLKELIEIAQPKFHLFGHVHSCGGIEEQDTKTIYRCCSVAHLISNFK
jgi:predicted phosphohydrolase